MNTTAADQSKIQKITNNSGGDIVVCMPLTSAETEHSNPIVSYNKDYVILRTPTGTVIKNGETDSVTLDRTYIKAGKVTYSPGYDLLISNPTLLTPVANIGVVQDYDLDSDPAVDFFDPVTVTSNGKTALKQASDFYQTIAAYPDTQLAKNYIDAMDKVNASTQSAAGDPGNPAKSLVAAAYKGVADFFKTTKSYQLVTLADIIFVQGFYDRFPFVWAHYADSIAYYLYSSDGKKTSFQGKLVMSKSGDIDITRANGGYTCQFLPAVTPADTTKTDVDSSKAQTLIYSDGVFADDMGSDIPSIALKGTFQLKRTFTGDPNDKKIITIVCGNINGQTAVGFDEAQVTKADNTTQDWLNSLFHPKTAEGIFNSVMQILGALMMLHFVCTLLYSMINWVRKVATGDEPVSKEDMQAEESTAKAELEARNSASYKKITGDKAKLPEDSGEAFNRASTEKSTLNDLVSKGSAEAALSKMKENLKTLEGYVLEDGTGTMQTSINEASSDIRDLNTKLSQADIADLKATLAEIKPQLQEMTAKVNKLSEDFGDFLTQQQKNKMKENADSVKEQTTKEEEAAKEEAEEGTSTDPAEEAEFLEAV